MARTAIDAADASLDEPLPDALDENLQVLFGRDRPADTVADWVQAVRESVREELDQDIATEDLCHVDDSEHVTRVLDDGGKALETHHFACFYDGLVLAGMTDSAVAVETVCPETGETVQFQGALADLASDAAVVSIGVANDPQSVDDAETTPFAVSYGATCPYVNAFASHDAYESWQADVDAATMALLPTVALAAARELAA